MSSLRSRNQSRRNISNIRSLKSTSRLDNKSHRAFSISAESITFTIATLIVAILIGLVLLTWNQDANSPPVLSVNQSAEVRTASGQFYVPFEIKNTGGKTVESVQVLGELRQGNQIIEAGEQQIDFLSGNETAEGAFVFSRDPSRADLTLRVASYKLP